jgi:hypothetical protein
MEEVTESGSVAAVGTSNEVVPSAVMVASYYSKDVAGLGKKKLRTFHSEKVAVYFLPLTSLFKERAN